MALIIWYWYWNDLSRRLPSPGGFGLWEDRVQVFSSF